MTDADPRLWHPWLRINRVLRVMLHTRWSAEAWFVRRFGFEAWSEVIARDCEGYVAKDETSLYEAGPTPRWFKVNQHGWTDAEDRWQRRIGAEAFVRDTR